MSETLNKKEGLISKESWDKLLEIEKKRIGDYIDMINRKVVYDIFGPFVEEYDHADVKNCKPKISRQDYNKMISSHLVCQPDFIDLVGKFGDVEIFFECLNDNIMMHPQQRFGQLICNYILPDYRQDVVEKGTKEILEFLFPDNNDPFFEESEDTYKRMI